VFIMTIQNQLNIANSMKMLQVNNSQSNNAARNLASGNRINRAADDAAGLAVSMKMLTQIGGNSQAVRNVNDGISLIQTAEGALSQTNTMVGRLHMLSVQASNGLLNSTQRGFIQMEVDQILSEINRTAEATDFNGIRPLNGSLAGDNALTLQIGDRDGEMQRFDININSMSAASIGLAGFNVSTQAGAMNALNGTHHATFAISEQRAALGAMQNRLEHTAMSLITTNENMLAANSRIKDADMADEMIRHTTGNVLRQASLALMSHAREQTQGILGLLNDSRQGTTFRA
jgi:flagellin